MKAVDFSEDCATANEKYLVGKSRLLSFILLAQKVPPLRDSKAVRKPNHYIGRHLVATL